jgi:uncharacterized membrane protein
MPEVKREEKVQPEEEVVAQPVVVKREQEKELFSWEAPARPFQRKTRQFYITVFAIAGLFILILVAMAEFLPILLIIALVFLYYVMSTVEPENVSYTITNKGIKIGGQKTPWMNLGRFWFTKRFDTDLLVLEAANITGRLELVLKPDIKESIRKTLSEYLTHEEVPPSTIDRAAAWVSGKVTIK